MQFLAVAVFTWKLLVCGSREIYICLSIHAAVPVGLRNATESGGLSLEKRTNEDHAIRTSAHVRCSSQLRETNVHAVTFHLTTRPSLFFLATCMSCGVLQKAEGFSHFSSNHRLRKQSAQPRDRPENVQRIFPTVFRFCSLADTSFFVSCINNFMLLWYCVDRGKPQSLIEPTHSVIHTDDVSTEFEIML